MMHFEAAGVLLAIMAGAALLVFLKRQIAALKARLRPIEAHFAESQAAASTGSWEWDMSSDTIKCSSELHRIYGTTPNGIPISYDSFLENVHPNDRKTLKDVVAEHLKRFAPFSAYYRIIRPDGMTRMIHGRGKLMAGGLGRPPHMIGTGEDVTERDAAQKILALQAEALERSNEELDQFARVVSHDLQEPLRTVASFIRILKESASKRPEAKTDEIISIILDGTQRMQALIEALRSYFGVDRLPLNLEIVDAGMILDEVVMSLNAKIKDAGAKITRGPLPSIQFHPALLAELFQNLLVNAIKYHGPTPPRVSVSAVLMDGFWKFSIQDGGIGIAKQYHKRIFQIFQRLHLREKYPGTGIGLAICKKIVERHGGRIWVESEAGKGAAFHFIVRDKTTAIPPSKNGTSHAVKPGAP